ncbi:MAG TPA: glycosyl hydrolase [Saprospiraceae bacterium]|nr:glycosyl hydrolase [Saprospiraceae bacterium]
MMKQIQLIAMAMLFFGCATGQSKITDSTKTPKPVVPAEYISGLKFRAIGPAVTSGRIADFAVNPKNHSEFYIAVASGGVWKTVNKGTTFTPIFDGQGSYSIGCVALDPQQPNTVWVGTGENNNQRSVAYGDGVYKSEDGGKTWQNMGLKTSEHIANIIIHPSNSNIVYVAAYGPVWSEGGERGVYKTIDGGKTWTLVKSVSKYTGCNNLLMDPSNPDLLYAAFHQRMRKVFTYIGGGPETGVFKSTDGGSTWTACKNGLPSGDLGRIGIAVSAVDPNKVYAVVEADENGGIYRSTNKGASWSKMSSTSTSGNYYQEIECDPHNSDKIYITDTYYKVSYDGGKTVSNLGEINKHIDNHAIWVDPNDPQHLMVGCDGGIYETYDHAGTWEFKSNLSVTQFYKVSTDNEYPFYNVHGGTQDNFSLGGPSRTTSMNGITNADWYVTSAGDGFETQVDPTDPNIIYAQAQYGALSRFDRKNGEFLFIQPIEGKGEPALRWNWDAPLQISSHDHKRLYFGANKVYRTDDQGNNWKVISPDLSRQLDRNTFEVMGKVWSVDAIAKNQSTDIFGQTTTLSESTLDENIIWAGTDDGLIHLTQDGGKTWTKFDNIIGVPAMTYVHQIIASVHNKATAYVCFNHHRYGDFSPYVFKTIDSGKTWQNITTDLPKRGSVYSIAEDHVDPNLLFVGTEFGLFFSHNAGLNWTQLKAGLPTIAVRDIEIQRRENDLVLATFGRGFYILDDYSPLRHINKISTAENGLILPIKDALMFIERKPLGLRDKGHLGSSYFSTPNPEVGSVFTYYLKNELKNRADKRKEVEKMKLEKGEKISYPSPDSMRAEDNDIDPYLLFTITDSNGKVMRQIKQSTKKGLNRMVWDFRMSDYSPVEGRYTPRPDQLFGSGTLGAMVTPGKYGVVMQQYVDGELSTLTPVVNFECKPLNVTSIPNPSPQDNLQFTEQVITLSRKLDHSGTKLSKIQSMLKSIDKAVLDLPALGNDILKTSYALSKELSELKLKMNGDASMARRQFETAPSINGRVGTILGVVVTSTAPVPGLYKESYKTALSEFEMVSPKVDALYDKVIDLVKKVDAAGGPYIDR